MLWSNGKHFDNVRLKHIIVRKKVVVLQLSDVILLIADNIKK